VEDEHDVALVDKGAQWYLENGGICLAVGFRAVEGRMMSRMYVRARMSANLRRGDYEKTSPLSQKIESRSPTLVFPDFKNQACLSEAQNVATRK
jgi:hypothetical protein